MANIKKAEKDVKVAPIAVRFTAEQKEKITAEAKRNNLDVSAYIRAKAIEESPLQISRETDRICRLVRVEEALGELKRKAKTESLEGIQNAINNLGEEIKELWRC